MSGMLDNRDEPLLDAGEMNHPSRRIMNRILKLFEVHLYIECMQLQTISIQTSLNVLKKL